MGEGMILHQWLQHLCQSLWSLRDAEEATKSCVALCSLPLKGLFLFQDKYLADMDELFSQVDEKRKVRMGLNRGGYFDKARSGQWEDIKHDLQDGLAHGAKELWFIPSFLFSSAPRCS